MFDPFPSRILEKSLVGKAQNKEIIGQKMSFVKTQGYISTCINIDSGFKPKLFLHSNHWALASFWLSRHLFSTKRLSKGVLKWWLCVESSLTEEN
jgi:hypothetical protein